MSNKWEALRGNIGFYVTMLVCLVVIGISGYYLLLDDKDTPASERVTPVVEAPVSVPVSEPAPEPAESVEAAAPEVMEVTVPEQPEEEAPPAMPEAEVVDDTPVVAEAPHLIVAPLKGEVLAAFSVDELAYDPTMEDWRIHDGVDISAKPGTTVLAACSGTVLAVEDDILMGTTVVIEHDGGYRTTYANLQATPNVAEGEHVSAGQIVGAVGTTAAAESAQSPHLHFSVTKDGDVIDPESFLNQ